MRFFLEIPTIFTASPPPHTFSGCLTFHRGTMNPTPVCWTTGHPPYMDRQDYGFMALINEIFGNYHYFHRITSPTHILGVPHLTPRHNKPNPVRWTTGHTPYIDGQDYGFMALINELSRKLPLFSPAQAPHHRPHMHSRDASPFTEAQ